MKSNSGTGRARILHTPKLSCYSPGSLPSRFQPGFQVEHQDAPTAANPVRQHYSFAVAKSIKG